MKKQKSMKVNFVINGFRVAFNLMFPMIIFPYVSRILLLDGIGKVEFPMSVVAYFIMLSSLGIPLYGIRECAKVRDNKEKLSKVFQEVIVINICSTVISYVLFFVLIFSVPRLYETKALLILISSSIIFTSLGVEWLYQAIEEYKYITVRSIIFKFVTLVGLFLFVRTKDDYMIYAGLLVLSNVGSNILNIINVRKFVSFKKLKEYEFKRHIKPIMTMFTMTLAISIYANLDIVMLGFLKGDIEVGIYTTAIKASRVIITVVTSLGAVLLPRIAYYVEHGLEEDFNRIIYKSLEFVIFMALPCALFLFVFSDQAIYLLAGKDFMDAALTMKILIPIILAIGLSNLIGVQILIPLGKEKITLQSVVLGALVNLILDFILIPMYAQNGAAISILIAEFCVTGYQIYFAKSYFNSKSVFKSIVKYGVSGGLMLIVLLLLRNSLMNYGIVITLAVSFIASILVYSFSLIYFKDELVNDILSRALKIFEGFMKRPIGGR